MIRRPYVTSARIEALRKVLKPRDLAIIQDVARLNVLSGAQLRRLHYGSGESARRLARLDLARLADQRLLARLGRRVGGVRAGSEGFTYALDAAGQRLLRAERRRYRSPWTPEPQHLRHALAVSELYVQLVERLRASDRQLDAFAAEPACWRWFFGPGGARQALKPDAYVVIADARFEDRYFVEVDCDTEATTRIASKAKLYVRYWQSGQEQADDEVFPLVLWIAPSQQRKAQLVQALSRLPAEHWRLFAISTFESAAERMVSGFIVASPGGGRGELP